MIESCNTVAIETHTKYGPCARATPRECGRMATTHHTSVTHTITMSAAASETFRNPAKLGMNSRLATRLTANGNATRHGNFVRNASTRTNPKLPMMTG